MKTYNYLFVIFAIQLLAMGCAKDDEPDVKIDPPVFNLQKSSAVEAVDLGLSVLWSNCNLTRQVHCGQARASAMMTKATHGTPKTMEVTLLMEA